MNLRLTVDLQYCNLAIFAEFWRGVSLFFNFDVDFLSCLRQSAVGHYCFGILSFN